MHDQRSGEGTLTWPGGREYVGQWEFDKYHGTCIFQYSKDEQKEGEWLEGQWMRWWDEVPVEDVNASSVLHAARQGKGQNCLGD